MANFILELKGSKNGGFYQSHCQIFKTLVSQEKIKLSTRFFTCDYTFLDPTNQFNHFAFVSLGNHWFPDDSNHITNGDHNDDNSDNNGNYVDLMSMMKVMIKKTTMIKIIMVMITVTMMMVGH